MGEGKNKDFGTERKKDSSPVQVHIRLKHAHEEAAVYNIFANDKLLHSPNDGRLEPDKWQVFDHIHSATTSNEDVYKVSGYDLVENALKGYNTAVFAYGQQGSGKTRTLMSKDGITAYTVSHLFNRISKNKSQSFTVSCSYLQIYNEHIYDLLNPDNEFDCTVREHKTRGLYVENVTCVPCKTPKDVYELINIGRRSLVLAETKLNHRSSRSHAVCQLQIECMDKSVRKKNNSILNTFSPLNDIIDEENEAYIDFDTIPFQRKNIKRSHSIAITKMNERNLANRVNTSRSSDSDQPERCCHISHHKDEPKKLLKKSHSFRGDRLPSYSKHFQERRYFNMSNMCDVKLYRGNDYESFEKKEDSSLLPSGIPVPTRYPSLYYAGIEPEPNFRPCERKKPFNMSLHIPRLRRSRGIDDSGVESNTSQSEEDISDINSDHGGSYYIPDKFQTSEHYGSEYLDLAHHDERFYDIDRSTKNRYSNKGFNTLNSKITIVDLAGSERVKKSHVSGERLKEAQHINLSLLELGNVISALADGKKKHVPYRNSVLTRLLQDTLGGNSKITFLLCVSTKITDVTETRCTLEFGQKLKKVLTAPTLNVDYYKWKYENTIADQKRMMERKQRKEARRLKIEQQSNIDQIEYNNVISEYDQSKTLIDMLQYMMGLHGMQSKNRDEADSLFTDVDTGTETDDTLTEASDLDFDPTEEEDDDYEDDAYDSHNIAFSDISLDDSILTGSAESLLEENTVDFDLFEIPDPAIDHDEMSAFSDGTEEMQSFEIIDHNTKGEKEQSTPRFDFLPRCDSNDSCNSNSLEEFIANELACFNDIDDEPPLLTSSPNCTNEDAYSSDETDSVISTFSSASEGTPTTTHKDVNDIKRDTDLRPTTKEVKKQNITSKKIDIPVKSSSDQQAPPSESSALKEDRRSKNAMKLMALRARLRNVRDTQHLHHVRHGCWCQREDHH